MSKIWTTTLSAVTARKWLHRSHRRSLQFSPTFSTTQSPLKCPTYIYLLIDGHWIRMPYYALFFSRVSVCHRCIGCFISIHASALRLWPCCEWFCRYRKCFDILCCDLWLFGVIDCISVYNFDLCVITPVCVPIYVLCYDCVSRDVVAWRGMICCEGVWDESLYAYLDECK